MIAISLWRIPFLIAGGDLSRPMPSWFLTRAAIVVHQSESFFVALCPNGRAWSHSLILLPPVGKKLAASAAWVSLGGCFCSANLGLLGKNRISMDIRWYKFVCHLHRLRWTVTLHIHQTIAIFCIIVMIIVTAVIMYHCHTRKPSSNRPHSHGKCPCFTGRSSTFMSDFSYFPLRSLDTYPIISQDWYLINVSHVSHQKICHQFSYTWYVFDVPIWYSLYVLLPTEDAPSVESGPIRSATAGASSVSSGHVLRRGARKTMTKGVSSWKMVLDISWYFYVSECSYRNVAI